jgi:hypothetical protein
MSLPIPEERDSNTIIVLKLIITFVTVMIGVSAYFKEGIRILKKRSKKTPEMGFTRR